MVVWGKDRDVFSRGDGSQAEEPLQRGKIMDDEKQSINISSNLKRGYKIKISFLRNIGLKSGHAPASFATKRILSEKLRFSCFSQVPSGSDYPIFRPILLKTFI